MINSLEIVKIVCKSQCHVRRLRKSAQQYRGKCGKTNTNTISKKFTYFKSLSLFFVAHCGQFQLQIATVFQLNKILSYPFPLIIDYFRISHSALCFPPKFDISFCFQMP